LAAALCAQTADSEIAGKTLVFTGWARTTASTAALRTPAGADYGP
jgi:hypothetical protein